MKSFVLLICFGVALVSATPTTSNSFANDLYTLIAKEEADKNFVFSPVSIKTCLALVYLGAEGSTADELKTTLSLSGESKEAAVTPFKTLLSKRSQENARFSIANRVYVNESLELSSKFNELASKYFESEAEKVKFSDSSVTANKINSWVEKQTENKIKNLVASDSLNEMDVAILVNAIYFKANWTNTFDSYATRMQNFKIGTKREVIVDMMFQEDNFLYGDLKDLDATAVELSYEGTDISMLILLPKTVDGLTSLESQLKTFDLTKISEHLSREKVRLSLPKFKIEFELSLKPTLEKLGIYKIFTRDADLSGLFETKGQDAFISEVKHKAFLEVNEMGTEAAAATYAKASLESLNINEVVYNFVADHPFFFAIKDKENVYFAGHVASFN